MIKCLGGCWKRTENSHRKSETCSQGIHSFFIYQQIHSFNINSFIHFLFNNSLFHPLTLSFLFVFFILSVFILMSFSVYFFHHFSSFFHKFSFQIFPYSFKTQVGGGILGWKGKYDINYQGYPIFYTFHLRKSFFSPISTYFPSFDIFS